MPQASGAANLLPLIVVVPIAVAAIIVAIAEYVPRVLVDVSRPRPQRVSDR